MLRWIGGVTRKDKIRNEHIRGTTRVVQNIMCSSSLFITSSIHFNCLSVIFLEVWTTRVVPRMWSFLILSSSVTPPIHSSSPVAFTSICVSCYFVVATFYTIQHCWLAHCWVYLPFSFAGILLSHSTLLHFLQLFQPNCSHSFSDLRFHSWFLFYERLLSPVSIIYTGSRCPCSSCSMRIHCRLVLYTYWRFSVSVRRT